MPTSALAQSMLALEARSLLTRLDQVRPFALKMPMVPAAALSAEAQTAIEVHMDRAHRQLRVMVEEYLHWLTTPEGKSATASEGQRRFTILKLRFNSMLDDFDIFADVISQRSEHETGTWISGLDVVAADALSLPGFFRSPPVICYLDRGHGAAIRRARTRLPGGEENPVAVIRVPRERMVGSGIGSSLIHEVGHQAAALLGLVSSLREALKAMQARGGPAAATWKLYERWISEIVADFWSVARIGIGSTLGLIGVVSLPKFFVFRTNVDDPHPTPWIRVKLSCAIGQALYPHPQWARLAALWHSYYPPEGLPSAQRDVLAGLESIMPQFITLLVQHRNPFLRGGTLMDALSVTQRQPERLREHWRAWRGQGAVMRRASPSLVFAVISQARADGQIPPEEESKVLSELLTTWAVDDTLRRSQICADSILPGAPPVRERGGVVYRPAPTTTTPLAAAV